MNHFNSKITLPLIISALIAMPAYAGGKGAGKGGGGGNRHTNSYGNQGQNRGNQQGQEKKQKQERKQIHKNDPGSGSQEINQMREHNKQ